MFEQVFKNIDYIFHKDAGCSSELDHIPLRALKWSYRKLLLNSSIIGFSNKLKGQ
jgi:hypothetical protein